MQAATHYRRVLAIEAWLGIPYAYELLRERALRWKTLPRNSPIARPRLSQQFDHLGEMNVPIAKRQDDCIHAHRNRHHLFTTMRRCLLEDEGGDDRVDL